MRYDLDDDATGFVPIDDLDDVDDKAQVYHPIKRVRPFASKDQALRYLLRLLEAGTYVRKLALRKNPRGGGRVPERAADGTDTPPDPQLVTRRPWSKGGRPPAKRRRGETVEEKQRRLARERKQRQRARQKRERDRGGPDGGER